MISSPLPPSVLLANCSSCKSIRAQRCFCLLASPRWPWSSCFSFGRQAAATAPNPLILRQLCLQRCRTLRPRMTPSLRSRAQRTRPRLPPPQLLQTIPESPARTSPFLPRPSLLNRPFPETSLPTTPWTLPRHQTRLPLETPFLPTRHFSRAQIHHPTHLLHPPIPSLPQSSTAQAPRRLIHSFPNGSTNFTNSIRPRDSTTRLSATERELGDCSRTTSISQLLMSR